MAITIDGIQDLSRWAYSKSCSGWKANRVCLDRDSKEPLPYPHEACVQAQRAADLLGAISRYDGEAVVGWLVEDGLVDDDMWR